MRRSRNAALEDVSKGDGRFERAGLFRSSSRLFYGWVIAGVSFVALGLGYSQMFVFSVFFVALIDQFHWDRGPTAGIYSLFSLMYGLFSLIAGMAVDRLGSRWVMPIGALAMAGGLALSSMIDSMWQLYVTYSIMCAAGTGMLGSVPNASILQRWFVKRRGLAIGIATAGIAIAGSVLVPFTQSLVNQLGWRAAMVILGAVIVGVAIPLTALLLRQSPEDMGLLPDGDDPASPQEVRGRVSAGALVVDREWASRNWTLGRAVKTRRFWFVFLGLICGEMGIDLLFVHQFAALLDAGYAAILAAQALAVGAVIAGGAKMMWGAAADRLGRERTYVIGMSCQLAAVLLLMSLQDASQTWTLYAYAALFGLGYGVVAPIFLSVPADIFGGKNFGSIFGALTVSWGLSGFIGPLAGGFIFDVTRSYRIALLMVVATICLSCIFFWLAAPRKVRLTPGQARKRTRGSEA